MVACVINKVQNSIHKQSAELKVSVGSSVLLETGQSRTQELFSFLSHVLSC